jgi:uncharacterized protein involved in exopolysaccharide biosynthesis
VNASIEPRQPDELDLRRSLRLILKSWRLLLMFCLAAVIAAVAINLFQPLEYSASAALRIPGYALKTTVGDDLLLSEEVQKAVLGTAGVGADVLRRTVISSDKKNSTLYVITVTAPSSRQAVLEADAWADEGVKWIRQQLITSNRAWLNKSKADLESSELDLLHFLDSHGLADYSILDLRAYEGMIDPSVYGSESGREPLSLPSATRSELRKLLRAQSNAASVYTNALDSFVQVQSQLQTNSPSVLSHGRISSSPNRSLAATLLKTSLSALVISLLAGVGFVLFREWWKAAP